MNDVIEVYEAEPLDPKAEVAPISIVELNIQGGSQKLVVKSDLKYEVEFQKALTDTTDWFSFELLGYDAKLGGNVIECKYAPMTNTLSRRSGTLSIVSSENAVGTFLVVRQGFASRLGNTWSWLKYGAEDPTVEGGARLISLWNATQKDYKYTSTVIEGQDEAYCYGRNHLLQLGSADGYGADVISPYIEAVANDSLVVVAFKAFAYADEKGNVDNGKVTFEVISPDATLRDYPGGKATFTVGTYDYKDAVNSIAKAGTYYFFVQPKEGKLIPSSTQFRIIAGDMAKMEKPNRIIIDNFYVYQVHAGYYPYLDPAQADRFNPAK